MDFSYIFRSAKLIPEHLEKAGFEKISQDNKAASTHTDTYSLRRGLSNGAFYAIILLEPVEESLTAQVYDSATNEKYALFDVASANGAFIGSLRQEVQNVIEEIRVICFSSGNLKEKYVAFLKEHFGASPDFPWADTPDYCVFRCKNQKWFALIMKIKYRQLGLSNDEEVWVVNMKADPDKIDTLIDRKSIFPAWHMNKKHWITVLLTAATDFDRLCALTQRSFELVHGSIP